jgi:demethylmenaquinone methyltransferase/2-methoxy-6-polyprenyl-1,4-benzoquinol methylase
MENKIEFFNKLSERWDENDKVSPDKYRRIVGFLNIKKKDKILDIGTGTGVLIPYILEYEKNVEIFAIDIAEKMIEKLKRKNFSKNVKVFVMDICKTSFKKDFFDKVIANACFPHFDNKEMALKEIYRILKRDGIFVISHPTGRYHVNEIHRKYELLEKDIIEDIYTLSKFVEGFGFKLIEGIDEKDFFIVVFKKL